MTFLQTPGVPGLYAACIGGVSALMFLLTAIPSAAGVLHNDGMQFIEVLRDRQGVLQRQKLLTLSSQSFLGIRLRDWDQKLQNELLQSVDSMQPIDKVSAHFLALLAAIDREETVAFARYAHWLSEHAETYPVGLRPSLTLELCLHALRSGDLTSARRWYSESKGGLVDQSRRNLVEAELANAEGRPDDSLRLIERARTQLSKSMDVGVRS